MNVANQQNTNLLSALEKIPKHYWTLLFAAIATLNFIRSWALPNNFTSTHFTFNYDFGFVKRGLIGEIFQFFSWQSYWAIILFVTVILIIDLILLFIVIKKFLKHGGILAYLITLIFLSSHAFSLLVHLVSSGYFDGISFAFVLSILLLRGFWQKFCTTLVLVPFMILVHEGHFVIFYPFVALILFLEINPHQKFLKISLITLISCLFLGLTIFVFQNGTIDEKSATQMYERAVAEFGVFFNLTGPYGVIQRNLSRNFTYLSLVFSGGIKSRIFSFIMRVLMVFPVMAIFSYFFYQHIKPSLHLKKINIYSTVFCILATISPIFLSVIAYDVSRWLAWFIVLFFLLFYLLQSRKVITFLPISYSKNIYGDNKIFVMVFLLFFTAVAHPGFIAPPSFALFPLKNYILYNTCLWKLNQKNDRQSHEECYINGLFDKSQFRVNNAKQ